MQETAQYSICGNCFSNLVIDSTVKYYREGTSNLVCSCGHKFQNCNAIYFCDICLSPLIMCPNNTIACSNIKCSRYSMTFWEFDNSLSLNWDYDVITYFEHKKNNNIKIESGFSRKLTLFLKRVIIYNICKGK